MPGEKWQALPGKKKVRNTLVVAGLTLSRHTASTGDPEPAGRVAVLPGWVGGRALTVIELRPDTLANGGDSDRSTFSLIVSRQEYPS
ncbi:hypothetical protein HOK021_04510 [Streptomyces hygroscopicus]|nr:hypothetical protein HOK021_04510 [Streptomyces hygroscopicus]